MKSFRSKGPFVNLIIFLFWTAIITPFSFSADHKEAFISYCAPSKGIAVIDIPSRQLIETISLEGTGASDWLFGSPDGKFIYFVTSSAKLGRLEVVSRILTLYPIPGITNLRIERPGICSKDGKTIFLIDSTLPDPRLCYINAETYQIYKEIHIGDIIERGVGLLDLSPDGKTIYVSEYDCQIRIGVYDVLTGSLINKIWIAPGGYNAIQDFEVAPSGDFALVTTMMGPGMIKIDLRTFEAELLGIFGQGQIRFFDDSLHAFLFPRKANGGDVGLKIFNVDTHTCEPQTFLARAFSGADPQGEFIRDRGLFVYFDSAKTYTVPPARINFLNPLDYSLSYIIPGFEFCGSMVIAEYSDILDVVIDIKPGSFPNSINLGSNGNVPVAIMSTVSFDARTIDPASVVLAGASVLLRGKGNYQYILEDLNGDGLDDMIVHIDTTALQLSLGDTEALLEAQTYQGVRIRGSDTIRIVPQ